MSFDSLPLLLKIVTSATLLVVGMVLLWRSGRRTRAIARTRTMAPKPLVQAPRQVSNEIARLGPAAELGRITTVIEGGRRRAQAISAAQGEAARHLDAAEAALNRLIGDIRSVMPDVPVPSVMPRRFSPAAR